MESFEKNTNKELPQKEGDSNGLNIIGKVVFAITMLLYFLIKGNRVGGNRFVDDDGLIFANYVLAAGFFVVVVGQSLLKNGWRFSLMDRERFSISVALLCVSAYTINLEFDVFQKFSAWCEIALFLMLLPLLFVKSFNKLPNWGKAIFCGVIGFGMMLTLYFSIYLLPTLPIGIVAILFLGLGIHFFAPLILLITYVIQFKKINPSKSNILSLLYGVLTPIVLVIIYTIGWSTSLQNIRLNQGASVFENDDFPEWYYLSQRLNEGYFNNLVLEGELSYSTPSNTKVDRLINMGASNTAYGDRFNHDPLIFTAALFAGELDIDKATRVKLLEVNYSSRHNTTEKLWTGKDLETKTIENNIKIYPEFRLAYNEKKITIKNTRKRAWRSNQEALYTFYLPEGSAVSSLSLWVDGKERTSRLTTKNKATTAYNKIVGVERRDPAIAHWQEGNTVTVRVFPCTPREERVFKIGITSPLLNIDDKLIYNDNYLKGPLLVNTEVFTNVRIEGVVEGLEIPSIYTQIDSETYQYSGGYTKELSISMSALPVADSEFCFNGNCYKMAEQKPINKFKKVENVYLDLNNSWTKNELERVFAEFKNQAIFVFDKKLVNVQSASDKSVLKAMRFNFNHLPLYNIPPKNSLIITKNAGSSPNMIDLKNTAFAKKTKSDLATDSSLYDVYSLNKLNSFFSTLNQFALVNVHYGNLQDVGDLVRNNRFTSKNNNPSTVHLDVSNVSIIKTADDKMKPQSSAPDHLLRLFGYNTLLKKIGRKYYNSAQYEDELLPIANEAFVLSPISTMVVLETNKDYDRFDIKKNENSLKNAKLKSSGSVPEPHEWVLICLAGMVLIFLYKKRTSIA